MRPNNEKKNRLKKKSDCKDSSQARWHIYGGIIYAEIITLYGS